MEAPTISRQECVARLTKIRETLAREITALGPKPLYGSPEYDKERGSVRQHRFELIDDLNGVDRLLALYTSGSAVATLELDALRAGADASYLAASSNASAWRCAGTIFRTLVETHQLPDEIDATTPDVDGHGYARPRLVKDEQRAADELGVKLESDA